MKILVYGLNFAPELTGIGKYTSEMAAWLAGQGHEVRAVTAPPYYPDWRIGKGYGATHYQRETLGNVTVLRCPLWVPSSPSGAKRLLHLASFAVSSLPVIIRQVFWCPDVVWVAAPALFCAPGGWLTARLCGAKAWLHIQDYEIDAAFELGMLRGNFLRRFVTAAERYLLKRFDVVSTISVRMVERARTKGVSEVKAVLFPNWVDFAAFAPRDDGQRFRKDLQIPSDSIVALYSGNMGAKQGLVLVAAAARELCGKSDITFVFCGNGVGRSELETACAGLSNVRFLALQPAKRLGDLLAMADIHMLPQRADAEDLVMPSKLTGMLASGRPVVATAGADTEIGRVVEGRGIVTAPGSPGAFVDAILTLAGDADLRARLGLAARRFAEENLAIERVLTRFQSQLVDLARRQQG